MAVKKATEKQVLDELRELEPEQWFQVLDFIGYLKHRTAQEPRPQKHEMTGRDLLESGLVGLWADRTDIGDSSAFARELRQEAEHRQDLTDDLG
ncbi:MAG: hypothetical protein PVF47_21100 [Anaerolineae bacterium]|jgi:hypothetical protein